MDDWNLVTVSYSLIFYLRKNIKTDTKGRIEFTRPKAGALTLRSSVEFPTPGEENGESYERVRHNITLVMPMPKS